MENLPRANAQWSAVSTLTGGTTTVPLTKPISGSGIYVVLP